MASAWNAKSDPAVTSIVTRRRRFRLPVKLIGSLLLLLPRGGAHPHPGKHHDAAGGSSPTRGTEPFGRSDLVLAPSNPLGPIVIRLRLNGGPRTSYER